MTTFQRARSEEQREMRRQAILGMAETMLAEMPATDVTLNELSRRVGLAKSNVLRYFESREAVLLELLDRFLQSWLAALRDQLAAGVDAEGSAAERADQLAAVVSRSLAERKALCDLFGAQAAVLERNVSVEVAIRHKKATMGSLTTLVALVREHLPELGDDAQTFCMLTMIGAGALAGYCPPAASVLAAYEAEPDLAHVDMDLCQSLRLAVTTALLGALPRS